MIIRDPNLERIVEDATVRNFLRCRETGYQVAEARTLVHSLPADAIERGIAGLNRQIEQLRPFLTNRLMSHADNEAVDQLALAMKDKLGRAREKGRAGWDDPTECTDADLSRMLREHVDKGDPVDVANFCAFLSARGELIASTEQTTLPYQKRVGHWMHSCFGNAVPYDAIERNFRFLEEALELAQSCGATAEDAGKLVEYVFNRPVGDPRQEVGGVEVTLAALCNAHGIDLDEAREAELNRVWSKADQIRAKHESKPKDIRSPLPGGAHG